MCGSRGDVEVRLRIFEIPGREIRRSDPFEHDARVGRQRRQRPLRIVVEAAVAEPVRRGVRWFTRRIFASSSVERRPVWPAGEVVRGIGREVLSAIVLAQERSICMICQLLSPACSVGERTKGVTVKSGEQVVAARCFPCKRFCRCGNGRIRTDAAVGVLFRLPGVAGGGRRPCRQQGVPCVGARQ